MDIFLGDHLTITFDFSRRWHNNGKQLERQLGDVRPLRLHQELAPTHVRHEASKSGSASQNQVRYRHF